MIVFYAKSFTIFPFLQWIFVLLQMFECEILLFRYNYYSFENMKRIKRNFVVYSAFFVDFIYLKKTSALKVTVNSEDSNYQVVCSEQQHMSQPL